MRIGTIASILLVALSIACFAADAPKVTLDASDTPIDQVMADIAKQANVQIVCEPGLKGTVTGRFDSMELEKLLSFITKSNNLTWQKVYLPAPKDDEKLAADQIKSRADAVQAVSAGTIVVVDPSTGKQKVFVEQESATPSVDPDKLGLKLMYVVSKPKVEAKPVAEKTTGNDLASKYKSLEAQRVQMLAQMTPEQRVAAMQSEMMIMMNMDPTVRQQIMADEHRARHEMPEQMQQQYRQMMHDTFRAMHGNGQGDWRGRGGDRGSRGDRGNRGN